MLSKKCSLFNRKRHEQIIVTGEKRYNCAYCVKKFTRKHDKKRHEERLHTKEKPKNIKEDFVDKVIDNEHLTQVFETNSTNESKKEIIKDHDIKEYENTHEITSLNDTSVTEEEISLNEENCLVIDLTDDNDLCIKASKYVDYEMCLICDMEFHTSVEALNHIKKEHIDIMIEDEISSPLMSKKEIEPFSFSQPNSLQIDVESNHLNTSLEDTPIHIQSKNPTVKSKISFTENNPSDLVDKKIDNEDSIDVFETNTTNQAKYEVDLTEHTSEISLPLIPMTKNKGKTVKRLRNKMKIKCDFYPFCKNVFYSRKRFDKHMEKGCSLWMAEFIPE